MLKDFAAFGKLHQFLILGYFQFTPIENFPSI